VGYSGGTQKDPTYHNLGDHRETIQMDFDPRQVSYEELLEVFWKSHAPQVPAWSRQYRAAVFFHNPEQERLARKTRDRVAARLRGRVVTEILPAGEFYLAEDYHQKYFLRARPELFGQFNAIYPSLADLVASTAAARVTGYAAGYGTRAGLKAELPGLGLSPAGAQTLLNLVPVAEDAGRGSGCPVVR